MPALPPIAATRTGTLKTATKRRRKWWAVLVLVAASASGRLLSPPPAVSEWQRFASDRMSELQSLLGRLKGSAQGRGTSQQPEFEGYWKTHHSEDLEDYLERAMGVGYLKRSVAAKASQWQRLYQVGDVVHLEISDRRGTSKYTIKPDGRPHSGKGFMRLPMRQRAKWSRDGSLLTEERYAQHLGGEEHGDKCSGDSCPLVRSRRSVDKSGFMVVEIERTLLNGDVARMRTYYRRVDD